MEDDFLQDLSEIGGDETSFGSNIAKDFRRKQKEDARVSVGETARLQLQQSAAASLWEFYSDMYEADTSVSDYSEHYDELIEGVPSENWSELLSQSNYDLAQRYKKRLLKDQEQQQTLAAQTGFVREAAKMATSLVDVDLPLMVTSGGTIAAGKTVAKAGQMAAKAGFNRVGQRVIEQAAIGATGGAISGAIVGAGDAISRADSDFGSMMQNIAVNTVFGAGLGAAADALPGAMQPWQKRGQDKVQAARERVLKDVQDGAKSGQLYNNPTLSDDAAFLGDSIGAARAEGTLETAETLPEEFQSLNPSAKEGIAKMRTWEKSVGFRESVAEDTENVVTEFMTLGTVMGFDNKVLKSLNRALNPGAIDHNKLLRSKSSHAAYAAAEIFEGGAGVGRQAGATAGIYRERYYKQQMAPVIDALENARTVWQKERGQNYARRLVMSVKDNREFSREIRLALDAKAQGLEVPVKFRDLVDRIEESNAVARDIMKGRWEGEDVAGSMDIAAKEGYYRHSWEGKNFDEAIKQTSEAVVKDAIAEGIRRANPEMSREVTSKLASAYVRRYARGGIDPSRGRLALMTSDNRSAIETALEDLGIEGEELARIRQELDELAVKGATKGYLKERVDMDMNTDIGDSGLKLVDLLSDDFERTMRQYAGDVAGSSALARKGIRSQADVNTFIDNMLAEQHALGEFTHTRDELEAMFSQFTGGAHGGYMWGTRTEGVSQATALAAKVTRASLLQRTGLTSLMDATNITIANGVGNAMNHLLQRASFAKGLNANQSQRLLEEMESIGVIVGRDHKVFSPHLAVNDSQNAQSAALATLHAGAATAERSMHLASGMLQVTATLQQTAAAATATNVLRTIAGKRTNLSKGRLRRLKDLGISEGDYNMINQLIKDGVIEIDGGHVVPNFDKWEDDALVDRFAAAMERGVNQQVQKEVIGESSVWMNTEIGKLLTVLKSFGYTSMSKQLARNAKIGNYGGLAGTTAMQAGWAFGVIWVGNLVSGKEQDPADIARLGLAYSANGGGLIGHYDAAANALGMDRFNFSPYGQYASWGQSAIVDSVDKFQRIPGAVTGLIDGSFDWNDQMAVKAFPMMNYYGMSRVWDGIGDLYK